jgi:hypothetical protein
VFDQKAGFFWSKTPNHKKQNPSRNPIISPGLIEKLPFAITINKTREQI